MTRSAVIVFCTAGLLFAQASSPPQKPAEEDSTTKLIERIKQGEDPNALLDAGRTGDPVFIPYLRERLRHDVHKHDSLKWQAQMALAKLNQPDQLQAIYCQVATGNETQVADGISQLDYVRGWFSIRILNGIIWGELAAKPPIDQRFAADAQLPEPRYAAEGTLAAIIPDGARQIESQKSFSPLSSESFQFWRNYILAHQQELEKLQPTGEGVDFSSDACKNGKPRKKH